ncbi:MAG: protein sphX [Candidatus Muproteobacteria bacterium RBG_16_64_10]|uniref:Phosphate-binding protein n=1 Tax=Candidatus Muproteobacteria bacterium RBG_16_64_10 TaxID=1817757 RepID=A0A1F6T0B0_9PROT|nr:MAG: protein sphX [Candidatus Muproteobacteria bacterium RBG_16_64_10]
MNLKHTFKTLSVAVAVAGALGAAPTVALADKLIKVDGSSTVFPITEAVAEEFQKANKGLKVTVGVSGTGGGFKKFCRGETDISDASRPIKEKEMKACKEAGIQYIEIPVAYDALTVVINPKNNWAGTMTVAELKKMWEPEAQGKVMKWNDVNPKWPNAKLTLFGPGADSGTFDYFTEAVNHKEKASRGDFTASEDDNVLVQGVARDKNAIGYFGYAYYAENKDKLKAVTVINPATGKPVGPSAQTVEDGSYAPLARPIFIYVSAKSVGKPEVKEFVEYYLKHAPKLVKEVKYVPLPASAYKTGLEHFRKKKLGTVFAGKGAVGVKINELLAREAKF